MQITHISLPLVIINYAAEANVTTPNLNPLAGLPWPPKSQPALAPPRLVRPPADAWMISATMHILDSTPPPHAFQGHYPPGIVELGASLVRALGWAAQPRASGESQSSFTVGER